MKYLVTGGAGFIGSNLAEKLLLNGDSVCIVDNLSTGNIKNAPVEASLYIGSYKEIFASLPLDIDGIYHLGIPSSSPIYRESRLWISEAIADFVYVLEFARQKKLRVVFASSSSIYNGNPFPWKEDLPISVTDFYTETRYYMERLSTLYFKHYGVNSIGLRLFSVYGKGERFKKKYANLISQLIWAKQSNQGFLIYGDGNQTRDFTYVSDVVDAFILAMTSSIEHDFFNVGNGIRHSLNDIVKKLDMEVGYIESPIKNYVEHTLADTGKSESILGFRAKYSLEEGLKLLQSYYQLATK